MNVQNILKLKKNFYNLSDKKIEDIHKTMNNSGNPKPCISMMTKDPSYKQIIVSIGSNNIKKFMASFSDHVINLNHTLKDIKLNDFIQTDYRGLIIVSNKVASLSDICVISNYIKNANNMDPNNIQEACLLQSKLYLKILGISYLLESTNISINSSVIKSIIKATHIFNNIKITSKPHVVKISLKSDMAII